MWAVKKGGALEQGEPAFRSRTKTGHSDSECPLSINWLMELLLRTPEEGLEPPTR